MPLLDRSGRRITDPFADAADGGMLLVLTELAAGIAATLAEIPPDRRVALRVPNTVDPATLRPVFGRLALIAIDFPSFSDGRGFSTARALRRAGFAGTLRARGPLIPDQFAALLACDIDEVEVAEAAFARQDEAQWRAARDRFDGIYATGYRSASILDQRQRDRHDG
jgi:uncharacterized protein (DUF934 family)